MLANKRRLRDRLQPWIIAIITHVKENIMNVVSTPSTSEMHRAHLHDKTSAAAAGALEDL